MKHRRLQIVRQPSCPYQDRNYFLEGLNFLINSGDISTSNVESTPAAAPAPAPAAAAALPAMPAFLTAPIQLGHMPPATY